MKRRIEEIYSMNSYHETKNHFPDTVVSLAVNMCVIWYIYSVKVDQNDRSIRTLFRRKEEKKDNLRRM